MQTSMASTVHAGQGIALESLPYTHPAAVTVLTPSKPGAYQGFTIDQGLQFTSQNANAPDSALEFHLGGRYASLTGTVYKDSASAHAALITIQDISNPVSGVKQLFQSAVSDQTTFTVDLHGVQDISIGTQYSGCCGGSAIVDMISRLMGTGPTGVTVLSPAANAIIPRGTPVSFLWKSYPGTTIYVLSISLIKQSTTRALTPASKISFTNLVFGATSYDWNSTGFLPGLYQYDIQPIDKYGNARGGASPAMQFTIAN
jgi:hypothetical protein